MDFWLVISSLELWYEVDDLMVLDTFNMTILQICLYNSGFILPLGWAKLFNSFESRLFFETWSSVDATGAGVHAGKERVKEAGCPVPEGCNIFSLIHHPLFFGCRFLAIKQSYSSRPSYLLCSHPDSMYLGSGFQGCKEHHSEGTTRSTGWGRGCTGHITLLSTSTGRAGSLSESSRTRGREHELGTFSCAPSPPSPLQWFIVFYVMLLQCFR